MGSCIPKINVHLIMTYRPTDRWTEWLKGNLHFERDEALLSLFEIEEGRILYIIEMNMK